MELLIAFKRHLVIRGLSKQTITSYVNAVNSYYATNPDGEITDDRIQLWRYHLTTSVSQNTHSTYTIAFRAFVRYINKYHDYDIDIDEICPPKRLEKPRRYISHDEVMYFARSASCLRDNLIVLVLFNSGMRVTELCKLDCEDLRDGALIVRGKGGKVRKCYISHTTNRMLRSDMKARTGALFVGKFGARLSPNVIRLRFNLMSERCGLTVTPHMLRHSFATYMLRQGVSIRHIQQYLGHAKISTTEIYTHLVDTELERVHHEVMV